MNDVELMWFWLRGRGTAPISSIRDLNRRLKWGANAEAVAARALHGQINGSTSSMSPRWSFACDGVARPDWSAVTTALRGGT